MKSIYRFAVWSNVFYLIPFAFALQTQFWVDAIAIALLFVASTAYHASGERKFATFDVLVSACVIVLNSVMVYLGARPLGLLFVIGVLLAIGLCIRYSLEQGDRGSVAHGWWHVVAAALLTACVLASVG